MVHDVADVERRLDAGEWLSPGQVAALLGVARNTVHALLKAGTIRHRVKPGVGAYRECNPEDVRKLLDARREEHKGDSPLDA